MTRKGPQPKRELLPDPKYRSTVISQLINKVLLHGKKSKASQIVYDALDKALAELSKTHGQEPAKKPTGKKGEKEEEAAPKEEIKALTQVAILKKSIDNIRPQLEVKGRRVGGATYQVPIDVKPRRSTTLAIRWLVEVSRNRSEKNMSDRLARELIDSYRGIGSSVKKRDDIHRMAEANKAFAHFRW
jgi:small subunit ribosomal protein S7